jgi:PadR family transcriptional regulator
LYCNVVHMAGGGPSDGRRAVWGACRGGGFLGKSTLGEFEMLVLFAVLELEREGAYGVPIRAKIEERTGRTVSTGAVYTALDRLSERGLVSSEIGDPTAERGGRRKRLYRLEPQGAEALSESVRTFESMSRGLLPQLESRLAAGPGARTRGGRR